MKKISFLLIIVIMFTIPEVLYTQTLDFTQISQDSKRVKKERKEINRKKRPQGFVVSMNAGLAREDRHEDYYIYSYPTSTYNPLIGESLKNGAEYEYYDDFAASEINIRIYYFLKNINLGIYVSPIVFNSATINKRAYYKYWNQQVDYNPILQEYELVDYSYEDENTEIDGTLRGLGSVDFGISSTIFNVITLSIGTSAPINVNFNDIYDPQSLASLPSKTLEFGMMVKMTKRFSVEYRIASVNTRIPDLDVDNINLGMFGISYNISKGN